MIIPGVTKLFSPDPGLINAVVIAHSWFVKLATDEAEAIHDLGSPRRFFLRRGTYREFNLSC